MTVAAIRQTREAYATDGLRERMARHHDDPDAAFWGWCDVWLDPAFRTGASRMRPATSPRRCCSSRAPTTPTARSTRSTASSRGRGGETQRLVVPGGHSPHLEQPDAVVTRIADFAAGLP